MDAKETQIYEAIIIAVLVFGILIAYFILSVIRQQKKMANFQQQNAMAEITILEKDRDRTAADLHDDIAPMLAAVRMKINSFELEDQEDKVQLEKTNYTLDTLSKRIREISFDLMPYTLKAKGLVAAIEGFVNYINDKETITTYLILPPKPLNLTEQQSLNIYRIVQELVHNTIKHAKATQLQLELKKENEMLVLLYQDNGKGFDYQKSIRDGGGLGLRSILNRINILNGKLNMENTQGKGTFYSIEFPL